MNAGSDVPRGGCPVPDATAHPWSAVCSAVDSPEPPASRRKPKVLLVDDDRTMLETCGLILQHAGFDVTTAACGRDGLLVARSERPDVILLDLRLPDRCGLDVLRDLQAEGATAAVVMVTGFGSIPAAVEATRLGAAAFLEKPLIGDDVVRAVGGAMAGDMTAPRKPYALDPASVQHHAAARWARAVICVVLAPTDTRRVPDWAKLVGASTGTLRTWCDRAGVKPKRSLLFARLLRATYLNEAAGQAVEDSLDVVDDRTLRKLLRLAGATGTPPTLPPDREEFLRRQRLVSQPQALAEVRRCLESVLRPTA